MRKALSLLPDVGFVNAYGLTETSSTIAVLTPDDHRAALGATDDAAIRAARLGGPARAGHRGRDPRRGRHRARPGRDRASCSSAASRCRASYTDIGSVLDEQGWFPTKDVASLDADGYLFIGGRSDDTIIRGGENIAPAEIEDVLVEHPHVRDCAVVGAEDPEWGQIIVAVVVARPGTAPDVEDLRAHVRAQLRGSRTPDRVVFRDELPTNATGKVLRRELVDELNAPAQPRSPHDQERHPTAEPGLRHPGDRRAQRRQPRRPPRRRRTRWCRSAREPAGDSGLALDDALADGNLMGKRYVDDGGAEVLVTKAGKGTLSIGATPLALKEAKPLPASD